MNIPFGLIKDYICVKNFWLDAKVWMKNGFSSIMRFMMEDRGIMIYAFVLLVVANKEDNMNSFISEHVGEWINCILDAVEDNIAVNLVLLF